MILPKVAKYVTSTTTIHAYRLDQPTNVDENNPETLIFNNKDTITVVQAQKDKD